MPGICHLCEHRPIVVWCLTERQRFCVTCDNIQHADPDNAGHVRYQLCDDCGVRPALLLCPDCKITLCQSCYSLNYNCDIYGHRIQIIQRFPLQQQEQRHNNDNNQHDNNDIVIDHEVGLDDQRRGDMFEVSCDGYNNCERWMFAMKCELCLVSNAIIYCPEEDQLLCHSCDQFLHNLEVVPPHMRSVLCVTCKRISRNVLIGASRFSLPPTPPPHQPGPGQA